MTAYQNFNINYKCKVKPTTRGMDIILQERARLEKAIPTLDWTTWKEPDEEGYLTMELWCVMELFGPYMSVGSNPPIHTEILIEKV